MDSLETRIKLYNLNQDKKSKERCERDEFISKFLEQINTPEREQYFKSIGKKYNPLSADISAGDINANDINSNNISAGDINARNIKANDISYYAVCCAYENIECSNIKGRRENSKHFCLDGEIKIKSDKIKIICEGKEVEISRESAKALNLIK